MAAVFRKTAVGILLLASMALLVSQLPLPEPLQGTSHSGKLLAQMAGGVGLDVAVVPNELNTLAAQLKEKEQALEKREETLVAQEQTLTSGWRADAPAYLAFWMAFLTVVLAVNFYLDKRRTKRETSPVASPSSS